MIVLILSVLTYATDQLTQLEDRLSRSCGEKEQKFATDSATQQYTDLNDEYPSKLDYSGTSINSKSLPAISQRLSAYSGCMLYSKIFTPSIGKALKEQNRYDFDVHDSLVHNTGLDGKERLNDLLKQLYAVCSSKGRRVWQEFLHRVKMAPSEASPVYRTLQVNLAIVPFQRHRLHTVDFSNCHLEYSDTVHIISYLCFFDNIQYLNFASNTLPCHVIQDLQGLAKKPSMEYINLQDNDFVPDDGIAFLVSSTDESDDKRWWYKFIFANQSEWDSISDDAWDNTWQKSHENFYIFQQGGSV